MVWREDRIDELSSRDIYLLAQLRQNVFVVEQQSPYADLDDKDFLSLHLSCWDGDHPVAYLRIVPPEIHPSGCPSLGRICTALCVRRTGLGRELVQKGLNRVMTDWPGLDCQINAQKYLQRFYESFGFAVNGEEFEEDSIPHLPMRWYSPQNRNTHIHIKNHGI